MPDNELTIILRLVTDAAEAADARYHARARQRIKETGAADKEYWDQVRANMKETATAQERSDRDFIKATKLKERAIRDFAKQFEDAAKVQERSDADYVKAVLRNLKAEEQLRKAAFASLAAQKKEAIAEAVASDKAYLAALRTNLKAEVQVDADRAAANKATIAQIEANERTAAKNRDNDAKLGAQTRAAAEKWAADQTKKLLEEIEAKDKATSGGRTARKKKEAAEMAALGKAGMDQMNREARERSVLHQQQNKEADETRKSQEKTKGSILDMATAYTALRIASEVSQGLRFSMQALAQSASESRDYIKGIVAEMEAARTVAVELAALRDVKPTAAFTAQIAREAADVGTTPENYQQGQKAFYANAAEFIGTPNASEEQEKAETALGKMPYAQAMDLQKRAMTSALAQGVPLEDSMKLMGTIVSKRKPGATNDEMAIQQRRIMENLKLATGYTGPLIGQANELIQESVGEGGEFKDAEEATILERAVARRNPGEASTYSRAVLHGLREIRANKKGQADELGITRSMDVFQSVEQAGKSADRIAQEEGNGVTSNDVLARYFKDIREFGGIRTAVQEGVKGGGFARARADMAKITVASDVTERQQYLAGQQGTAQADKARGIAAEREQAAKGVNLLHFQRQAAETIASGGELQKGEGLRDAILTAEGQMFGQGDRKAQAERRLTGLNLERGLEQYEPGRAFLQKEFGGKSAFGFNRTGSGTSEELLMRMANLLQELRDDARKRAKQDGIGLNQVAPTRPPPSQIAPAHPAAPLRLP